MASSVSIEKPGCSLHDIRRSIPKDAAIYPWSTLSFTEDTPGGRVLHADEVLIHIPWLHAVYEEVLPLVRRRYPTARTSRHLEGTLRLDYLSIGGSVPVHVDPVPIVGVLLLDDYFRGGEMVLLPEEPDAHVAVVPPGWLCVLDGHVPHGVRPVTFGTRVSVTLHYYDVDTELDLVPCEAH